MNNKRIKPGTIPAANVCETGTFVKALNKMAAFEGGIRASSKAAEAASTTTKGFGYPCSIIFGIIIVPTAVIAAKIEPQNAAKKPIEITIAIPKPPGQCPTNLVAKSTSLVAAPPRSMTIQAKIKRGTAINTCLVRAPKETWISTDHGSSRPNMAAMELPIPKTKNIGTEKHSRHNETTNASKYIKRPLFLSGLDHKLLERLAPEQTMLKL